MTRQGHVVGGPHRGVPPLTHAETVTNAEHREDPAAQRGANSAAYVAVDHMSSWICDLARQRAQEMPVVWLELAGEEVTARSTLALIGVYRQRALAGARSGEDDKVVLNLRMAASLAALMGVTDAGVLALASAGIAGGTARRPLSQGNADRIP